jgi:hypothetical protein
MGSDKELKSLVEIEYESADNIQQFKDSLDKMLSQFDYIRG